jgi:prephenate dehydrogenase
MVEQIDTLAVVGVGLIGASVGLAARERGLARRVLGVGRRPDTLDRAHRRGAIDEAVDLPAAARRADVLVFCTPVDRIAGQVLEAAPLCRRGALLTDAGSTKAELVAAVEAGLPERVAFVGGHPLAGSEKSGPNHARADLFAGRVVVLTPTPQTPRSALERAQAFWEALGARVLVMAPDDHDRALALTSHLPHLTAAALAGVVPTGLHGLTAGGFRDTTRIAAGEPELWAPILLQNRPGLLAALDRLTDRLRDFRGAIAVGDGDALRRLLGEAKAARDALANGDESGWPTMDGS